MEFIFSDYLSFFQELFDSELPLEKVLEIANHERSHFETSRRLGYDVVYGISLDPITSKFTQAFVDYPEEYPNEEDMLEITLAPEEPSERDFELAWGLIKKLS